MREWMLLGRLFSTPRWIRDANGLVAQLPSEAQDAIHAAKSSGNYDTPEFQAADAEFSKRFGSRSPPGRLGDLKLPTLFVVGEYDEVPVATALGLQARVAGSIVRAVADAGHAVQTDQTQVFNDIIAEFTRDAEERSSRHGDCGPAAMPKPTLACGTAG